MDYVVAFGVLWLLWKAGRYYRDLWLLVLSTVGAALIIVHLGTVAVLITALWFGLASWLLPAYSRDRRAKGAEVPKAVRWVVTGCEWVNQQLLRAYWRWRLNLIVWRLRDPQIPLVKVTHVNRHRAGWDLSVVFQPGRHAGSLDRYSVAIASMLRSREVSVARYTHDARTARVSIITTDPLAAASGNWPLAEAAQTNLWNPIPLGIYADGRTATVVLPEHNLLMAGEPGAGKTVTMQMLISAAALDPTVELLITDGKEIDLEEWRPRSSHHAGASLAEAHAVLDAATDWMAKAYARLRQQGRKKVQPGDPLLVVVCDELAYYATSGKEGKEFTSKLRDLVQRGRAAGVIVLAATQKPATEVIPSSLRDLFAYRLALRCTTPDASDVALGKGQAALGCDASKIDPQQRGVGWLLAEGSRPGRMRAFFLSDLQIAAIASRAAEVGQTGAVPGASGEDPFRGPPDDRGTPAGPQPPRFPGGSFGVWYRERYLTSEWWRSRSDEIRAERRWRCEQCGSESNLDVHHLSYTGVGHGRREQSEDLQVLCRKCHTEEHPTSNGHPEPSVRAKARAAVKADPTRSNRDIAREIGCEHHAVGRARKSLLEEER